MYRKKWLVKPLPEEAVIQRISNEIGVEPLLSVLLAQRGVTDFDSAKTFFRPAIDQLNDPFRMKDMGRAVERIDYAVKNRERIMVYGDYDVDGTTAVAMVFSFLKKHYDNIEYYIPDRYTEGYGVSIKGIDTAKADGCRLVICLDCGIKAVDKIQYAEKAGIDFIVCDHHYPGDELPSAFAILNPKRRDCDYPFKELSGCGVGFKLLQAYASTHDIPQDEVFEYLDMVAVSIASDIVPMNGENRVLAALGIQRLNTNPRIGLKSLMKLSGLEDAERQVDDIVFKIGPRINAAGRMESGKKAVELLISDNREMAHLFGVKIDKFNIERRNVDADITRQALRMLSDDPKAKYRNTTVLYNPEWHKGVIGIVASRLTDTYYRPTVILTRSGEQASGSARSVEGFDLYSAIEKCSDLLESFGGHMFAAGITLKLDMIDEFSRRFEEAVSATITEEQLTPVIAVDAEVKFADFTPKFMRILKQFRPFGPQNMQPVFVTRRVADKGNARIVGKFDEHLKLDIVSPDEPDVSFPAIGFQMGEHYNTIRGGQLFDICYTLSENTFRGQTTTQLEIKDIRPTL